MLTLLGAGRKRQSLIPFSKLHSWKDASDLSTIVQSSGQVSNWIDKINTAYNATQSTGANKPLTGTRTINGLNAIEFNGSKSLSIADSTCLSVPQTVFIVILADELNGGVMFSKLPNTNTDSGIAFATDPSNSINANYLDSGNIYTRKAPLNTGEAAVFSSFADVNKLFMISKNNFDTYDDSGNYTLDSFTNINTDTATYIGKWRLAAPTANFKGILGEIMIFDGELNFSEQGNVFKYLIDKWGATDLGRGLLFHVDASDLSSITKDGSDYVSAWNGIAPTTVNLLQADGTRQPKYQATGFGGMPTINFLNEGGITDMLVGTSDYTSTPLTFVVVASPTSFTFGGGGMIAAQGTNNDFYDAIILGDPNFGGDYYYVEHGFGSGFAGDYAPALDELAILTYTKSSTTGQLYHNGDLIGSQVKDAVEKQNMSVFMGPRYLSDLSQFYSGKVSEAYIYDRVLTPSELTTITNHLKTKWGIV